MNPILALAKDVGHENGVTIVVFCWQVIPFPIKQKQ